jgi:magnesium transporter
MSYQKELKLFELEALHPADAADELQRMEPERARNALIHLSKSQAGEILAEMEEDYATGLLDIMETGDLVPMLSELPANEVADLIPEMDEEKQSQVLSNLSIEDSEPVNALLKYEPDTAGGIMSDQFVSVRAEDTLEDGLKQIRAKAFDLENHLTYLYVIDEKQRLVGVVPLRALIFRNPATKVSEVMNNEVRFLRVTDDQEEIARQFEHYHYLGLPVLDQEDVLIGIVHVSDVLSLAQAEATEDMQLMVGLPGEERVHTPWLISLKRRSPWLLVNLLTTFFAAAVIGVFESTIAQWTALAVFLPIIAGQGGNAGMQTLTVVIRDMALGELSRGDGGRALSKEILLGVAHGLAIGTLVGLVGYIWKGDMMLGIIAAAAMLLNLVAAAISGIAIPFGLKSLKVDPALASSIFLTTVTDVAGFFFFLGLAYLALNFI